jgi:drug/metabolite transporter (DMT)-like permease
MAADKAGKPAAPNAGPAPAARLRDVLVYGALMLCVGAIFGGYSVFTAAVFAGAASLNPLIFAFARDMIGSALLLGAAAVEARRRGTAFLPAWSDAGSFLLLGLLGVWGAQGMSALAIKYATPVFFAASTNLQPVVTLCLSLALRAEPWRGWGAGTSWGKVGGLALTACCGAAVVVTAAAGGPSSLAAGALNFPLGASFAALQVCMGGALPVVQKPLLARYSPLHLCGWGYGCGTVLLAMSVITGATNAADWDGVASPRFIAGVAYAGILSSAVAYAIMSVVNNAMTPTFVAAFMPSTTFFAIAFAWAFQGRTVAPPVMALAAGMWAGIVCLVLAQHRERALLAAAAADKQPISMDGIALPLLAED